MRKSLRCICTCPPDLGQSTRRGRAPPASRPTRAPAGVLAMLAVEALSRSRSVIPSGNASECGSVLMLARTRTHPGGRKAWSRARASSSRALASVCGGHGAHAGARRCIDQRKDGEEGRVLHPTATRFQLECLGGLAPRDGRGLSWRPSRGRGPCGFPAPVAGSSREPAKDVGSRKRPSRSWNEIAPWRVEEDEGGAMAASSERGAGAREQPTSGADLLRASRSAGDGSSLGLRSSTTPRHGIDHHRPQRSPSAVAPSIRLPHETRISARLDHRRGRSPTRSGRPFTGGRSGR